jgi:PTS system galactitol-specific IIC component
MDVLMDFFQTIIDMGATVMLPIVMTIVGMCFRMKFGDALKAGLMVGIGFQGLSLTINLLLTVVNPAVEYYSAMGSGYTVADVGWAAVGASSFSVPFAAVAIALLFIVNVVMIRLHWTHTMNVDIWNFIHFLIPGTLAYALTGNNFAVGLGVTLLAGIIALKGGDHCADAWQEYYGLEGTTCSTGSYVMAYPVFQALDKLYDHIPGFRNIDIDISNLSDKIGLLGDTSIIGLIVGAILGIISARDIPGIITMAVGFAAVLVLIPRMVAIMMEGISPIGTAATAFMRRWLGEDTGDELVIGMDVCLGLGDPNCMVITAIAIPWIVLMALVIPGMNYFPMGALTGLQYDTVMPVLADRGNFVRALISTLLFSTIACILASVFAPEATAMMNATGIEVSGMVTDKFFGMNYINVVIEVLHRLFG